MTTATSINPRAFQMLAIAKALELWAMHKLQVNRAYSPKAMMTVATKLTGKNFKARDYVGAAKALRAEANQRERANV